MFAMSISFHFSCYCVTDNHVKRVIRTVASKNIRLTLIYFYDLKIFSTVSFESDQSGLYDTHTRNISTKGD